MEASHQDYQVKVLLGLPTAHTAQSQDQFFFVNGRPIRDKLLSSIVKVAYHDVIPHGRFPAVVLFLTAPWGDVDVNVHPAKTEVRFANGSFLREWLLTAFKKTLAQRGMTTASHLTAQTQALCRPAPAISPTALSPSAFSFPFRPQGPRAVPPPGGALSSASPAHSLQGTLPLSPVLGGISVFQKTGDTQQKAPDLGVPPALPSLEEPALGHALGPIHGRYIVAQNKEGCLIVDQHAAHERLVYEALKKQLHEGRAQSEALLIPLLVSLTASEKEALTGLETTFKRMGLDMEILPPATLLIRAIPALLKDEDWQGVVADLLDTLRAQVSEEVATLDPVETALNMVL
jgi:DNA mismatch repair protein MutL